MIAWLFAAFFFGLIVGVLCWNLIADWVDQVDRGVGSGREYLLPPGGPIDSLWDEWERPEGEGRKR